MTYTVRYERDESGWWVASVKGVRGCHTQGRTIEEAERRAREALGLFVDNADRAKLARDICLPASLKAELRRVEKERQKAEEAQARASDLTRRVLRELRRDLGLSVRDAGTLLGISGARVHQLGG